MKTVWPRHAIAIQSKPADDPDRALMEADADYLRSLARKRGDADEGSARPAPSQRMLWHLYGYAPYAYADPRALAEAYSSGRYDQRDDAERNFNARDMGFRSQRLIRGRDTALEAGLARLRRGDYAKAVTALTLATKMDNGDPASRIHLAQARMALGHYEEGGIVLRRALQLQPKLVYLDLNLDRLYGRDGEFEAHIRHLADWAKCHDDADAAFLLGYMEYQAGDYDAAYKALRRARKLGAHDQTIAALMEITRPASVAKK